MCPCLLLMAISTSAFTQEIREYSMYEEFGDIMFNAPGRLVKNGKFRGIGIDDDYSGSSDTEQFRYRGDGRDSSTFSIDDREFRVNTGVKKQANKSRQVWKFRPLDEENRKQVIKIEEDPVKPFRNNRYYRPPMMMMPGYYFPVVPY